MSGDVHVRFCERLGVKIPRPTRLSDTAAGAESSAIIFSVIETVKANGLEPWKYLRFVLGALPLCKTVGDFERLLPYNCKATDTLLL